MTVILTYSTIVVYFYSSVFRKASYIFYVMCCVRFVVQSPSQHRPTLFKASAGRSELLIRHGWRMAQ